jgi:DNA polymerase
MLSRVEGALGDRDELAALARGAERLARRAEALGRRAGWRAATNAPGAAVGAGKAAPAPASQAANAARQSAANPLPAKTSDQAAARPPSAPAQPPRPALERTPGAQGPQPAPAVAAPLAAAGAPDSAAAVHNRAVAQAARTLEELAAAVANCRACELCATRTQTVFADGSPTAKLMFVGEGPGAEEDRTGVPFVGDAGQLLSKIIADGMKLDRARDVYIANVVKCRPPGNRDPSPEEKAACTPFLERQIELVDPRVIVPLGRHAAGHLLRSEASMSRLRGQVVRENGRAIVPTFHPAYLLRTPAKKKECWEDIQLAMRELGLPLPPR